MPINNLYHTWFVEIRQLRPQERITRIQNFAWLLVGIHQSRSVYLSRIAGKIPGKAKVAQLHPTSEPLVGQPGDQCSCLV